MKIDPNLSSMSISKYQKTLTQGFFDNYWQIHKNIFKDNMDGARATR